jgi:hypothetical protein
MTSTTQLQREADSARVGLADTLDQLRDGLAPAALSAEAIALAKDGGLTLLKGLADQARANPMPVFLIGAGLAMLLTRTTGGDVARAASSTLKSAASGGLKAARATGEGMASTAAAAKEAVVGAAEGTATSTFEAAANVGGQARGSMAAARDTVNKSVQSVKEEIDAGKEAVERGRQQIDEVAGQARAMAADARASVGRLIEEQPILVAALGAALGAAVGALLPLSQAEKDVLSGPAARTIDAGRNAVSDAADVVRHEVADAEIGARMGKIAEKVVQNVTEDISHPARP